MSRIYFFCLFLFAVFFVNPAYCVSYGDLYEVDWCPCDPEEQFNEQGSVVLGKTVMCPCSSMYSGYGRTLKKDVQKVTQTAKKVAEKVSNFKYYIGVDFNKSEIETNKNKIVFDKIQFLNPVTTSADEVMVDQDNIGVVLGMRPHPNIGIEAFYNRTIKENKDIRADMNAIGGTSYHVVNTYTSKYQAFGVDVIGYLPVTNFFDFVAFVGLGQYYFDNEVTHEVADTSGGSGSGSGYIDTFYSDFSDEILAWRVGGGLQFNVGRGVVLRAMYRYIMLNSTYIKNMQEFSVGARFVF